MTYELAVESDAAAEDAGSSRHYGAKAVMNVGREPEWLRRIISIFYQPPARRKLELARRLRELDAAVSEAPDSPTLYIWRGELFLQLGDGEGAKADFEAALELVEAFDPTKGWGLVEQVMRDRALRGLDSVERRL